ncbi:MAG TPA: restriction endonuclease subunit S [Rectinema sp.]|jgi:type I restriction enzyme S subunit|nr:restriction endonuclease subunit S [Rectinema sp.]
MGGEWAEYRIGEIAAIVGGSTPSTVDPSNFNGEIPWLTPKDLSSPHDRYISRGERNLSRKGFERCSAQLLPVGTVLLTSRAPIGYVAIAKNEIATNQGFRSLVPKPGFDSGFLYYWIKAHIEELQRHANGSTFQELSGAALAQIRIRIPHLSEQQAIACILGAFDDKIELNRQMNRTLEEMARAIFKSWFVDFDPVRAKAAVRRAHPSWTNEQVSRAACPNLKPEIAELFPDSFEDSKLGEIPRGWKVRPIGDVVQILGGGTPSTKEPAYWEGSIHPFCTPKDMASLTDPVLLQTERHLTDKGLAKVSSGQLPLGTVLLSSRAPIGYLAVAETPISINQGIIAMVCDGELPNLYVLHWTKSNMDRILTNANGSTFMEISKRNFRPIAAVVPSPEVLNDFMRVVEPMHRRVVSSLKQIRQLANLRDFLLPRLISGDLVVAEGERIVGRIST